MLLISIIIPTFNRSELIFNCLNSIIMQTYTNWECIVVDDGSKQHFFDSLDKFIKKDSRISLYKRPIGVTKGANSCRNYGLKISKGSSIVFFDSDDLMKPFKLEKQIKLLKNNNNEFTISQSEVLDKINNKTRLWGALSSDVSIDDYIQFKVTWQTGAVMFKKSFLINRDLKPIF